jgi:site-specific DNA recombinase
MKKAVIYARYSSDRQTEQSIEGQLRVCKEFADRNGYNIVGNYIDRATTGTNDNRSEFQRMLADSSKHFFEFVIVYKLDRFSRNRYDSAVNKATLKKNGVRLISAAENITDTPEGIILESMLEGIAEYYSAELSQKVKRGQRESRIKGNFTGGPTPYGYDVVNKKIQINDKEATVVRMLFDEYMNKKRIKDLVDKLKEQGIKNKYGKSFTGNMVARILRCEKYKGIVTADDTTYTDIYPALVSQELFDNVGEKLSNTKRTAAHFKSKVDFILSGKLYCGECGTIMSGDSATGHSGKQHYYYKCFNRKKNKNNCSKDSLKKDEIEQLVVNKTVKFLNNVDLTELAQKVTDNFNNEIAKDSILISLQSELKATNKSLTNLLKALENGIFSETTNKRLKELEEQKTELDNKIASHSLLAKKPLESPKVLEWFNSFKVIDTGDNRAKDRLISLFVNKIIAYKDYIDIYFNVDGDNKFRVKKEHHPNLSGSDDVCVAGSEPFKLNCLS